MSNREKHLIVRQHDLNTTSTQMLRGAAEGDPESWVQMVRLYTPYILRCCRHGFPAWQHFPPLSGVPRQDAEDLAQKVFATILDGITTFTKDGKPAAFRRWVYTITRYKVLEHWKDPGNKLPGDGGSQNPIDQAPDTGPRSENSYRPVPHESLRIHLQRLHTDWRVFWEREVKQRSAEEVAEQFGLPTSEVDPAVTRVLKSLGEVVEDGAALKILLLRRLLDLVCHEFEPRTWDAFLRVTADGLPVDLVAKDFGITPAAVHTLKSRVLKRLRGEAEALELYAPEAELLNVDVAVAAQFEVTP